jgi:hypothetical protein
MVHGHRTEAAIVAALPAPPMTVETAVAVPAVRVKPIAQPLIVRRRSGWISWSRVLKLLLIALPVAAGLVFGYRHYYAPLAVELMSPERGLALDAVYAT